MRTLLIVIAMALTANGQTVTISDTVTAAVGGGAWTGDITVTLNAPGAAQPLYSGSVSLAGWSQTYCVGVSRPDCTVVLPAGTLTATLYRNDTITPAGTSYQAVWQPTRGRGGKWNETWVVPAGATKLSEIRAITIPTPATVIQASQIAPGSATTGQALVYNGSTYAPATVGGGTIYTASAVIDVSPVYDGTCVLDTTAVTVTGAALGGRPSIGSSYQPPEGVTLTAKVTGPNSMKVEMCNWSGATYDAGSATYYFGTAQ